MLLFIYFNPIIGPDLLFSIPEDVNAVLSESELNQIKRLMDASSPGFFSHTFSEELVTANLFFMIPSNWARGKQEMVMITKIIEEENPNLPQYAKKLKKFQNTLLRKYYNLYQALYIHNAPENYKEDVEEQFDILKSETAELSKKFSIRDRQTIGKLYQFEVINEKKSLTIPHGVIKDLKKILGDRQNYFLVYQKSGEYVLRFIPTNSDRILKVTVIFKGQMTPASLKALSETLPNMGISLIFTSGICQETGTGKCIYEAYFDPLDNDNFDFISEKLLNVPNIFEIRLDIIDLIK